MARRSGFLRRAAERAGRVVTAPLRRWRGRRMAAVVAEPTSEPLAWASRPARRGERATAEQVRAVREGLLPRSFAERYPGTEGARAVRRVQYLERRAEHPDLTAREAVGHYRYEPGSVRVAMFFAVAEGGVELLRVDNISAADERRAGIYMLAVRGLVNGSYRTHSGAILRGEAAKRHFRARFRAWRPIAGRRVAFDPDAVLAAADAAAAAGIVIAFVSPKKRRSRRGRS